jgi:hypothetical protein
VKRRGTDTRLIPREMTFCLKWVNFSQFLNQLNFKS